MKSQTAQPGRRLSTLKSLVPIALIAPASAFLLSLFGAFDGLYGQDAYAYLAYANGPLRESVLSLAPPAAFYWPPGYPLLVLGSSLLVGSGPLAGQLVSLGAGFVVALFTGLLAAELGPNKGTGGFPVPALATLVMALNGQLWLASSVVMSDAAGLAAATVGAWALARFTRGGASRWLLLAAAATAWAVLTRWAFGLPAVPFTLAALAALRHRGPRAWPAAGGAVLVVALVLAPAWLQLADGPADGGETVTYLGNLKNFAWSPANTVKSSFDTVDGHLDYRLPMGLFFAAAPARSFAFAPLLALLLLPGAWLVARQRSAPGRLILLGWPTLVLGYHAGSTLQNVRFILAIAPPLAVLIAIGSQQLGKRWLRGPARRSLKVFLACGLLAMAAGGVRFHRLFTEQKQNHLELVRWTTQRMPAKARLLTFNMTLAMRQYSDFEVEELYGLSQAETLALATDALPAFLLLDLDSVERQWQDHPPGVNYRALRDGPGLVPLGQLDGWHLFRAIRHAN